MGMEDDPSDGAFGDTIVPLDRTDADAERLAREFAAAAGQDYPDEVANLTRAFDLVASDLGVSRADGEVEVLWMPAEIEGLIRPFSPFNHDPSTPGVWWRGHFFVQSHRRLIIGLDLSYGEDSLMYEIARAIQETVEEHLGRPRPRCPLHVHPLSPCLSPGVAIWECPRGDELWWCRMGSYREATASD